MHPDGQEQDSGATQNANEVSGRFLGDLFGALERQGIPASGLLGDLPIPLSESGVIVGPVDWNDFCEFMRRLGRSLDGPAGLERAGETVNRLAPAKTLSTLAGLAASPRSLYKAAAGWALRRAIPGIETHIEPIDDAHIEIRARIADDLRGCPELFHFATGGARVLPRVIGLRDAVVTATISEREASYLIAIPPSPTLAARLRRVFRTLFSSGSVLRYLEAQQLELHTKNEALERANQSLEEIERRYRALVDTAVDVLCELDADGRVVYVSASIEDLIGYSPAQVTGSHYRLWIPREWHDRVDEAIDVLHSLPEGRATQERIKLHAENGEQIFAELTARTYDVADSDDRRLICIIRNITEHNRGKAGASPAEQPATEGIFTVDESALVEHVVLETQAAAQEDPTEGEWIEVRKLVAGLRDGFAAAYLESLSPGGPSGAHALEVDLTNAPDEIRSEEALLATSLRALLDWAAARSRPHADDTPAIRIEVESLHANAVSFRVIPWAESPGNALAAAAALDVAARAATSMAAELIEETTNGAVSQRIVITTDVRNR